MDLQIVEMVSNSAQVQILDSLEHAQQRAFAIRCANFPGDIHFHAPGLKRYETEEWSPQRSDTFVPVRLTGTACVLNCDHCRGTILNAMQPVPDDGLFALCARLAARGARGVLLSGASNREGQVPLTAFGDEIRRVKEALPLRVLVHTGLVDRAQAEALWRARVDAALVDIIGAEKTIREIYHLKRGVGVFEESLAWLAEYSVPTMPHIVLGLHYGEFRGEGAALDMVARYPVRALVLVVLMPLLGTAMARVQPPAPEEVGAFFVRAREKMPGTPLLLGCTRPGGVWKETVDRAAVDGGLNGIAYPAEGIVAYARARGLRPRFHETCCGVEWTEGTEGPM
ncbi:MAG: radical SAM protein [Candidatus Methylomirabilales bacterium]